MDTKQLLAKNKALIVAYALTIVPLLLWLLLVQLGVKGAPAPRVRKFNPPNPSWQPVSFKDAADALKVTLSRVNGLHGKIPAKGGFDPKNPLYGTKFSGYLETRNKGLEDAKKALIQRFRDADDVIERWFEKWKDLKEKQEPPYGDFTDTFKLEMEKLASENPKITGFDATTKKAANLYADPPPNQPGQMKIWQKRFQIQREIVLAMKEVGGDTRLGTPPDWSGYNPSGKKASYEVMPVKFGVVCSFRDLPKVVREVLARKIVFRLTKLDMEMMEFILDRSSGWTPNAALARTYFDRNRSGGRLTARATGRNPNRERRSVK